MDNIRAYGAGLAGGKFDANIFFRKPTVIFKSAACVLGALLWYSVSKGGWHRPGGSLHHQICLYGNSASTCSFASALGFFAFAGAGALLFSDARFDTISSIPTRKRVVLADLVACVGFFGINVIAFFTFWSKLSSLEIDEPLATGYAKFGILLTLFSSIAWGGASFFAWRRHEEGAADAFSNNFDDQFGGVSSEVHDGYGYGGNSDGIGSVGAVSAANSSYQGGAVPPTASYQSGAPPSVAQPPPANSFVGTDGYGY